MRGPTRVGIPLVAALVATAVVGPIAPVAQAAQPVPGHTRLVPETVRANTPVISDGEVSDIAVIGSRVVLAGTFISVRNSGSTTSISQRFITAYNINTGQLDLTFRPTFDRPIAEIEVSPDGQSIYAVGQFNNVNGIRRRKIVKLNANGTVNTAFVANANARASAIDVGVNWVYVGGQFSTVNGVTRGIFAAVNPNTGAVDPAFDLPITVGLGPGALLQVQTLALTTDESRLLVVHTGHRVDGEVRTGLALVDTASKSLLPWQTDLFDDNLDRVGGVIRLVEGSIAPDNSYFVAVSGSGGDRPPISDTAMAFPMSGAAGVEPLWVSRHFDSVYSVAISEVAVYVGGHFYWEEAPGSTEPWPGDTDTSYGRNNGEGAAVLGDEVVIRDMLGALDPATGKALAWDPGATAFEGIKALLAVPRGLLVGHDGSVIAGRRTGRHGFFDFATVPEPVPGAPETVITDPFPGITFGTTEPHVFTGAASAAAGVQRVQLEIQVQGTNRYLQDDLTTIGSWNGINATLDAQGSVVTGWSLSASPPPGNYILWARATAVGGARDPTKARAKFYVDDLDDLMPTTAFVSPPSGPITTNTFTITGTAQDDVGVVRIQLVFRVEGTTDYLQDDGTVGPGHNAFRVDPDNPGDPNVTWSYEVTLPDGSWRVNAAAVDTAGQVDTSDTRRNWDVYPSNAVPTLAVTSPTNGAVIVAGTPLTIAGTAADDVGVHIVEIRVQNLQTAEGMAANGTYGIPGWYRVSLDSPDAPSTTWSATTPELPPGVYDIRARAYDSLDVATPTALQPRLSVTSAVPGDAAPDTALDAPGFNQNIDTLVVNITGTATDNNGVQRVAVVIRTNFRYLKADGTTTVAYTEIDATLASPGATSTAWSLPLTLPQAARYDITARAVDGVNQYDTSTTNATATWLIFPGDADPTIQLDSPLSGQTVTTSIPASGRAFDDVGVGRVEVQVVNGSGQYLTSTGTFTSTETWINAFVSNPNGTATNWNWTSPALAPGTYTFRARSVDVNGQYLQTPETATGVVVV